LILPDHGGVAPLAGAWIETFSSGWRLALLRVAPLAGAWIETLWPLRVKSVSVVAPLAGAWIETTNARKMPTEAKSRAPRGRVD
tara:strand:+ start:2011 stop:2262 length:252 start_codon:yes stop_codon:yes gene_type:complete